MCNKCGPTEITVDGERQETKWVTSTQVAYISENDAQLAEQLRDEVTLEDMFDKFELNSTAGQWNDSMKRLDDLASQLREDDGRQQYNVTELLILEDLVREHRDNDAALDFCEYVQSRAGLDGEVDIFDLSEEELNDLYNEYVTMTEGETK